jgi:deoxyribonuclease-4
MLKLGFHVSIQGTIDRAVDRAKELGCDTFQIFTRNPRSWAFRALDMGEVDAFREKRKQAGIDPVFGHMPYILNLASPKDGVYRRSIESLSVGLGRCSALGIPMLVTHIGSHLGSGPERGVAQVLNALNNVLDESEDEVVVLIENGSGSKNKVGSRFEELGIILDGVHRHERLAVCLDTCHAFAAGYDLRTPEGLGETLDAFGDFIGFERLKLVHLNDSVGGLGSGVDHHEHIGLGEIGIEGFSLIIGSRLADVPMVMETPVDSRRTDAENMRIVRELASSRVSAGE